MHTKTYLMHAYKYIHTQNPAESIDGHELVISTNRQIHKDTQAQMYGFVLFLQFVILQKLQGGKEGSGKVFRHLSLTTSPQKKKHSHTTVGHFVNHCDDSVAVKCQNKWRREKKATNQERKRMWDQS